MVQRLYRLLEAELNRDFMEQDFVDQNGVPPPGPPEEDEEERLLDDDDEGSGPLLPGVHETGTQLKTLSTTRTVLVSVVNDLASIIDAFGKAEGMSTQPEITSQVSDVHTSAMKLATAVHKLTQALGT